MKTISNFVYDHPRLAGFIGIVLLVALLAIGNRMLGERIMEGIYHLCMVGFVGWFVFSLRSKE